MNINSLYKINEKWIHQPWYDSNSVFKLVEITKNRIRQFGVDCIWENVETGFRVNHWDNTMRELTKEESREFKLNLIVQNG
jgi:hypothetical protein